MTIPVEPPSSLSVFVWGLIFREPELHPAFCQQLRPEVMARLPNRLYLAGWGLVTFEAICRGEVSVNPYRPILATGKHEFLTDAQGKPVQLSQVWPGSTRPDAAEYLLSMILEKPFGFMSLKVRAAGPVQLSVNPCDFIPEDQFLAGPKRYTPDSERTKQLTAVA
jgi:hypothetical protein